MPRSGEGRHRPLRRRPTRLDQDHHNFGELGNSPLLYDDMVHAVNVQAKQRLLEQCRLIIPIIEAPLKPQKELTLSAVS